MKEIKLTKPELERLLKNYADFNELLIFELVEDCEDLENTSEEHLYAIYNAFCRYLHVDGLCIYKMDDFYSMEFADCEEAKRLTENVDLDDIYFSMNLNGYVGCYSFNDLHSFLKYRIPLSLKQIKKMLEFTFDEEEEGEEDD